MQEELTMKPLNLMVASRFCDEETVTCLLNKVLM